MNLPAARRPCQRLRAVSSESWHPPGCAPTSIQGPRAGGATQRLVGRLARLQSKSPRVHARITQLAGFPLPSSSDQVGGKGKEKKPPCAARGCRGDPFPAALAPRQLCLVARGAVGAAWLRRAPRELLPGRAQVRRGQRRRLPDRAGQKPTLLGARRGTPTPISTPIPTPTPLLHSRFSVRPPPWEKDPTSGCQDLGSGGARAGAGGARRAHT